MVAEYTKEWLELETQFGGRFCLAGSVEEMRAQSAALGEVLGPKIPPPSPAVSANDGEVDGVQYRLYRPVEAASKCPLPVGIYTHGGGLISGDLNAEDFLCRLIAELTPSVIISVDYRLAPEHKWPAQMQDTLSVFKWARQNAFSFGGDPSRFYTIGGSSGGLLALSVANRIVSNPQLKDSIKGIVALVPGTLHWNNVPEDYKSMFKSYDEYAKDTPMIDKAAMKVFYESASGNPEDSELFTALATENHRNYPPTYLATCENDPVRDDVMVMEQQLKKVGVPVKNDFYKGLPHYFWIFPGIPEAEVFIANLVAGVQWIIKQM